jgi:hypothetical protein
VEAGPAAAIDVEIHPAFPFGTLECDLLHIRCPQHHGFVPKQTLGGSDVYGIVDSNRDVDFHAGAREKLAYAAQDKRLNLFGRNLSTLNVSGAWPAYRHPSGDEGKEAASMIGRVSPSVARAPTHRWSWK